MPTDEDEFYKKLMAVLPPDVAACDDASNNRFLDSGQGALIMNPPWAWTERAPRLHAELTAAFPSPVSGEVSR